MDQHYIMQHYQASMKKKKLAVHEAELARVLFPPIKDIAAMEAGRFAVNRKPMFKQ